MTFWMIAANNYDVVYVNSSYDMIKDRNGKYRVQG